MQKSSSALTKLPFTFAYSQRSSPGWAAIVEQRQRCRRREAWRAAVQPQSSVLYFPVRQTPLLSGVGPSAVTTSRRQATFDSASWTARCLSQCRLLLGGCNRVAQHGNRSSKRGDEGCACVGRVCGACGFGHRWVWWPPPCPHAWILFTVGAALLRAHSNPGSAGAHSSATCFQARPKHSGENIKAC